MRDISTGSLLESLKSVATIVFLARLDYASGVVAVNTTDFNITWNSDTYLGFGDFAGAQTIKETTDQQATQINFSISGIDTTNIAQALEENYQGRDARLYVAFLNPDNSLVDDPVLLFRGKMDNQKITFGPEGSIDVAVVGRLADLQNPDLTYYNNQDQQDQFPGDKIFEFVTQAVNATQTISWGK